MDKLVFSSSNEALMYLANTLNRKVIVAAKSKVKNPRSKPKNKSEEKNWNRSDMWGDPKNHKYPLFNASGNLDVKKCKSALRYLNMPRSKKSYPNNKARAKVLTKVIKAIFKLDPSAKIKYQAKDKMYKDLPVSLKKKMSGYEVKKKASLLSIDYLRRRGEEASLFTIDSCLRRAEEEHKDLTRVLESLKSLVRKHPDIMSQHLDELGMVAQDLTSMSLGSIIRWVHEVLGGSESESEGEAVVVASDSSSIKDDLNELKNKSSSPKYDKTLKQVLGNFDRNMTVAELVDQLRDTIAKADKDEADESEGTDALVDKLNDQR